jgi:hypothetical protein
MIARRRMVELVPAAVLAMVAVAGVPAAAPAQEGDVSLRVGFDQASGEYGGVNELDDRYVPVTLLYRTQRIAFRATVPYLEVEFVDPVDSSTYTQSGLGDVVLGLTFYDVFESSNGTVAFDLTGKVELPTADEDKGLGNGEPDYSLQADFYKHLGKGSFVGTLGYKARGEPTGVLIEDGWLASVGGLYRFSTRTQGSVWLDYRESSVPGGESIREATASLSRDLDDHWRVQAYLVRGLSDASLDWGAGFSVRRVFKG